MIKFLLPLLTRIINPFGIAAFIFFIKPSDEKCKTEVLKQLAGVNIQAASGDIVVRDRVF